MRVQAIGKCILLKIYSFKGIEIINEFIWSRDALLVDFEGANSAAIETNETLNVSAHQLLTQQNRVLEG